MEVTAEAGSELILGITDNGTGMGSSALRSGLADMSERAQQLEGTMRVGPADATAGTGTILEWRVP